MGIKEDWMYVCVYNGKYCADDQQFADKMFVAYDYARTLAKPEFLEIVCDISVYVVICDRAIMSGEYEDSEWLDAIYSENGCDREL